MKNKEFYKLLKKNKSNLNAGFTLTELLVGLFMSVFVVGALGFGLMQMLQTTRVETSKIEVRGETSRALDFISDEVRRARTIETNDTNAGTGFNSITNKTVVLALDIPEITDSPNVGVQGRVVYYLKSTNLGNWQGPQVLYRWGPPLDANGDYNIAGVWQEEALIDGIDDTNIATDPCVGDTLVPALGTASGFHACINGGNNTAQLYLTGETKTAGETDTYTANTKVVARARTASPGTTSTFSAYTMSYKTLNAEYNCHPSDGSKWKMRTDFVNDTNSKSWIHQDDRQPQPVEIDTNSSLTITSVPVAPSSTDCLSKGDETATGDPTTEPLSAYTDGTFPDGHTVSYDIDFVVNGDASTANNWLTFNGNNSSGHNEPDVNGDGTILILKNGSIISSSLDGYDFDEDSSEDQDSLGSLLESQGYATSDGATPPTYTISNLNSDERIMAVEVGQTDKSHPGFDNNDSVFLLSSDVFAETY